MSKYNRKNNYRLYTIWNGIVGRCTRPSADNYDRYGGNGIDISKEWSNFENFCKWSIDNGYKDDLTIDRVDNTKGYSKENCRWVTWGEQNRNRTDNVFLTLNNVTKCMADWTADLGFSKNTIAERLSRGWSVEEALTKPLKGNTYTFNNKVQTLEEWAKTLEINIKTLASRIYTSKWTIEKAFTTPVRKYKGRNKVD